MANFLQGRRVFATKTFENSEPVVEYRGYLATPKKALNCKRENRFQPETDAFMFFFKWKGKEYWYGTRLIYLYLFSIFFNFKLALIHRLRMRDILEDF